MPEGGTVQVEGFDELLQLMEQQMTQLQQLEGAAFFLAGILIGVAIILTCTFVAGR